MQRVTLILLAALCGTAMAVREAPMSPAGRELLQDATACARSVPNCASCRYQRIGTVTMAVCQACNTGFVVKNGGRACWCAPGYKANGADAATGTCDTCGLNSYCVGAKATWASATATACGTDKVTTSTVAKSEKECVAKAGFGWTAGSGAAAECVAGTYNPGLNNRACTTCPGGLTTIAAQAKSASACVAPAGSYYYRGKAVKCAMGFYKGSAANSDCTACPLGFTTADVGKTLLTECTKLKPGYAAVSRADTSATIVDATPCAADTYRTALVDYAAAAITCTGCPTGCITNGVVGATSDTLCLTPPGYSWTGTICSICAIDTYNQGYNRETCTACPSGFITGVGITGVINSDGCYVPAGYGTTRAADGTLSAAACPINTYGRADPTYGLVDVECTKCLDNTNTGGLTGRTSAAACVTNPGYGYDDGAANLCDYGYWSAGSSVAPCAYCGDGKNTTALGAVIGTDCQTAQGWTGTTPVPCIKGTYKSTLGTAACTTCTGSTTTSMPYGAVASTDCDTCLPGYGATAGSLPVSASCTICPSGTYSSGGAQGGAACDRCPETADYSGVVVSRPGSVTSDSCVFQFATTNSSMSNGLEWDTMPMLGADLTVQTAGTSVIACQEGCAANAKCQYFEYLGYVATATARCFYRLAAADIVKISASVTTAPTGFYVMFEVKEGQYVAYDAGSSASAAAIGTTLLDTYTTFALAKTACDGNTACAGFANTGSALWRTFQGVKNAGTVGKIRVVGEAINSWIA